MFEVLKDRDGNTYTPVWGTGRVTHYRVNGSKDTFPSSSKNPNALQWEAFSRGLVDRHDHMFSDPNRTSSSKRS